MTALRDEMPGVRVIPRELSSEQQRLEIASGQIDLGLVRYPMDDDSITSALIETEPLLVAIPNTLDLVNGDEELGAAQLAGLPLILFPREFGPPLYDQIMRMFRESGLTPRLEQEAVQMTTIVGLVAAGFGVAIVPESVAAVRPTGVRFCRLVDGDRTDACTGIYLASRRIEQSTLTARVREVITGQSSV